MSLPPFMEDADGCFLILSLLHTDSEITPYSNSGRVILKRRPSYYTRPRSLDSRGCLGLVLSHLRSQGPLQSLCLKFGTTNSVADLFLRFGRRLLLKILKHLPGAQVRMPPVGDIRVFQGSVEAKYPLLRDVWFCVDGLKLRLQKPGNYRVHGLLIIMLPTFLLFLQRALLWLVE
jgi:hypothetical protein